MKSMISFGKKLKEIRESSGFSQEQLSLMLNISRPTLTQIENDKRKIKPEELKKLSEIFNVSVDFLLGGKDNIEADIDESKKNKFKELILYVLEKVGAKHNVGKVVLYKLLYFIEFDYFEKYNKYISGYPFIKLPMGPAPLYFDNLVKEMKEKKEILSVVAEYYDYFQLRYMPNREIKKDKFSKEEQDHILSIINRYSDYSATDISEKSHDDKPWQMSKDMDLIDYDLVKFRQYPYSIIAREKKLKQAMFEIQKSGLFNDLEKESDAYEEYRNM